MTETRPRCRCSTCLADRNAELVAENAEWEEYIDYLKGLLVEAHHRRAGHEADITQLRSMVSTLRAQVAAQTALITKAAGCANPERLKELEDALAPFAAVFTPEWDHGALPPESLYPVRMGDLRKAARAMAGTRPPGA